MSLESLIESLIGALNANTEAHGGKPGKGAAATATKGASAPKADAKITMEQVKAAIVKVKDAHGKPAAVKIIKDAGGALELAAIKPAKFAAVMAACDEIMNSDDAEEGEDGDDEL